MDDAREMPGMALVVVTDLVEAGEPLALKDNFVNNRDGPRASGLSRPLLAADPVRHMDEAVAMIVAERLNRVLVMRRLCWRIFA